MIIMDNGNLTLLNQWNYDWKVMTLLCICHDYYYVSVLSQASPSCLFIESEYLEPAAIWHAFKMN